MPADSSRSRRRRRVHTTRGIYPRESTPPPGHSSPPRHPPECCRLRSAQRPCPSATTCTRDHGQLPESRPPDPVAGSACHPGQTASCRLYPRATTWGNGPPALRLRPHPGSTRRRYRFPRYESSTADTAADSSGYAATSRPYPPHPPTPCSYASADAPSHSIETHESRRRGSDIPVAQRA